MIYARLLVHGAPEAGAGDPDQSPPGKMHQNIRINCQCFPEPALAHKNIPTPRSRSIGN